MASLKDPIEAHRSLFFSNQQRPLEESNLHTDLHQCPQGRISNEDGRHRQPTASRAGAEKSSEALYQPCTDVGVTAPDESAMADTEILQPRLTQRVALMGWGDIGWLMVESMEGGGDSGNQNPFSGVGLTPQMRQQTGLQCAWSNI